MGEEIIKALREGPVAEGEGPDGIELFDLDDARNLMHDAADEITRLRTALVTAHNEALERLLSDVISDVHVFRDHLPEEDESWESWYYAAFDMLGERIRKTFAALKTKETPNADTDK